jgi:hypothetical protein
MNLDSNKDRYVYFYAVLKGGPMRFDILSAPLHFGQITKANLESALGLIRNTTIHITPTDTYDGTSAKQVRTLLPTYTDPVRKIGLKSVEMKTKGAGNTTFSDLNTKDANDVLDPSRTLWKAPSIGQPEKI